jgi:phage replication O-like protein O
MANPQKENGYTAISNELMEALAKIRIPGEARQVLDVIIRKTYGFNKKVDQIATSQFMELTGLKRGTIHRARKRLLYTKLITVYRNDNGQSLSYSLQKDYHKWIPVYKNEQCTKMHRTVPIIETDCIQKCIQSVPIIEAHKRKKDTYTKDTIQKTRDFAFLKDKEFEVAFNDFLTMRKEKRKPATERARELVLIELHKYDIKTAIIMLEQSIMNSWQGVFPLKKEQRNGTAKNDNRSGSEYAGIETDVKT